VKRRPRSVVPAVLVLGCNGALLMFAGVVNLVAFVIGREHEALPLAAGFGAVGSLMLAATLGLHSGRRLWWFASIVLLPMAGAFHFFDSYAYGDGRFPYVWGIVVPAAALVCIFLPSARAYVRGAGAETVEVRREV
jgi:hypothetical protein